ncbi:hypothetical protein [Alkalicoccobacillus porphyridii]|uniref:hypothetical protein n=1 Tax=Alkalicoccobacillus porphyridii TaxID=2597270 RepID=UPI00163D4427|nr:hypothetical protein [Alkalicoccobacillus porphyridii]
MNVKQVLAAFVLILISSVLVSYLFLFLLEDFYLSIGMVLLTQGSFMLALLLKRK